MRQIADWKKKEELSCSQQLIHEEEKNDMYTCPACLFHRREPQNLMHPSNHAKTPSLFPKLTKPQARVIVKDYQ
jgi:hypothetical protein